ncbi:MAG: uroporphyrinogen-III C-methyltransferase [Opitutae bacterium]|nr:uroporphyrinogen-III C-methyltransferase [Opitutae bacterium]
MKELSGTVSLVGAGPGDPELITIRGRDRLAAADVVIYDDLAGRALLEYCRADCECIYVGKRCGRHSVAQERIIALLLEHAQAGRRVVRLKGGDPFVFGRGGEELMALVAAGIPCEVVPGVTAAAAAGAAAGVPLTHRDFSSAVVFLTGHESPEKPESRIDWAAYARLRATLCIYMGARRLNGIAEQLIEGGLEIDIPVAVVSRASRPDQRVEFFTLHDLVRGDFREVSGPALAIIGEVARVPALARELAEAVAGNIAVAPGRRGLDRARHEFD